MDAMDAVYGPDPEACADDGDCPLCAGHTKTGKKQETREVLNDRYEHIEIITPHTCRACGYEYTRKYIGVEPR